MRHDYEEPEQWLPLGDDEEYFDDYDYYDDHMDAKTWDDMWIEDGPSGWIIVMCRPTGMICVRRGAIASFTCSPQDYMFDVYTAEDQYN